MPIIIAVIIGVIYFALVILLHIIQRMVANEERPNQRSKRGRKTCYCQTKTLL
jgi:hypothetical protein